MTETPEFTLPDNREAKALTRDIRAAFATVPFPFDHLIGKDDELIQWLKNVFDEKSKVANYIPSPWMPREKMDSLLLDFQDFSPEEAQYVFPRLLIDMLERAMQGLVDAVTDARSMVEILNIDSYMSPKEEKMLQEQGLEDWLEAVNAERADMAEYKIAPFQTFSSWQIIVVIQWLQFIQRRWVVGSYEEIINSSLEFWQAYHTSKSNIKFNS